MVRQTTNVNGVLTVNTSDSSSISFLKYESDSQIMIVSYRKGTGKQYEFPGVTQDKFNMVKDAPSLGKAVAYLKKEMGL